MPVFTNTAHGEAPTSSARLTLKPSSLRPHCPASERIFVWRGVNDAIKPPVHINDPVIAHLAALASRASLQDTQSYGSALRKFHLFCDIFTIPESDRLPASFELLHSFALWAASDPEDVDPVIAAETTFEPVSVKTVRKYLSGIAAWHQAQGWPRPLSEEDLKRIDWSIRGLANLQKGRRTRPLRPPITLLMLRALRAVLNLDDPFDACVWAMACCAFWGMMRFGECSVKSRADFDGSHHLKREDCHEGLDQDGKLYARLDLPDAKTALPGEIQHVYLVAHVSDLANLCPIRALHNLKRVVPAGPKDPLFSWRDSKGDIRPMVKDRALDRINAILGTWGFGTAFGHSFRIGGASYYLAQKVSPEIIRLAGRWKSLAYEAYLRALELCISRHIGSASLCCP
ncbi:hypothetical protein B0H14DRAFT_2386492 [Mycena olivaceomarginata]|nr:hypothetical protein B0H14DRAFT_2386492 [Mycena olivaceomarginata]